MYPVQSVDIYVRYSKIASDSSKKTPSTCFDKLGTLSFANQLVYNDQGGGFRAHFVTFVKFAELTITSPLIALVRLVRSAAFLCSRQGDKAVREFVGALFTPFIALACLIVSPFSYMPVRCLYARFEAWINKIDLDSSSLPSYSHRVGGILDGFRNPLWNTAPCMQPLLEKGYSKQGGLLDPARMQKIFPSLKVKGVTLEQGRVALLSEYQDEQVHYTSCGGAYEHRKQMFDCCCYRVEQIYDRFLCCKVAQGTCSLKTDLGKGCGFVSCGCGSIGVCCCYGKEEQAVTDINVGCFGGAGVCTVKVV